MGAFAMYYVNRVAQPNGDHEVHTSDCRFIPVESNREYLGVFDNCGDAVQAARKRFRTANGCYFCSPACHLS